MTALPKHVRTMPARRTETRDFRSQAVCAGFGDDLSALCRRAYCPQHYPDLYSVAAKHRADGLPKYGAGQ